MSECPALGQTGNGEEEGRQEGIRWMTGFEIEQDDLIGDKAKGGQGESAKWET